MKHLIFLVAVLLSARMASAVPNSAYSRQVFASVSHPIAKHYSNDSGSLVFAIPLNSVHIKVINETACAIALNGVYQNSVPVDTDIHNVYSASTSVMNGFIDDDQYLGGNLYLRSNCVSPTDLTVGTVTVEVW